MAMFGFLVAAELPVRLEQRLQQMLAAAGPGERILLAHLLHRRRSQNIFESASA